MIISLDYSYQLHRIFTFTCSTFEFRWIKEEYDNPEVFITENGWSDKGELEDLGRIKYLHDHLESILEAVVNDETNLKGYTGKRVGQCERNSTQSIYFKTLFIRKHSFFSMVDH